MTLLPLPRSLWGVPVAAALFGAQALPLVSLFSPWLEMLPGAALYAALLGVAWEVLAGRVAIGWAALPVVALLLSAVPRWRERDVAAGERADIAAGDGRGVGPGAGGLGVSVDRAAVARALARRYAVTAVYAPRELALVDYLAFRPATAGGEPVVTGLPSQPAGTIEVSYSAYRFTRGPLEGFRPTLTAIWPDGRTRARRGAVIERVSVPAFPLAGCPTGDWLKQEPCRVRWARPFTERVGYQPADSDDGAADEIARLIGLPPLAR